jgi:hypothetical protein
MTQFEAVESFNGVRRMHSSKEKLAAILGEWKAAGDNVLAVVLTGEENRWITLEGTMAEASAEALRVEAPNGLDLRIGFGSVTAVSQRNLRESWFRLNQRSGDPRESFLEIRSGGFVCWLYGFRPRTSVLAKDGAL